MKKILTNYRYYALFALCMIAMLGIFSVPLDGLPFAQWAGALILSKTTGLVAAHYLIQLIRRWEKAGTIPELTHIINH